MNTTELLDAYDAILRATRGVWIVILIVAVAVNLVLVGMVLYNHTRDPEDAELRRKARKMARTRARRSAVRRDEEALFREIYGEAKQRKREKTRREVLGKIAVDVVAAVLGAVLLILPAWRCTALTMDLEARDYVAYFGDFDYRNARAGNNNVFLTERGGKWIETGKGVRYDAISGKEAEDGSYRGYVVYGRHSGVAVSFEVPAVGVPNE